MGSANLADYRKTISSLIVVAAWGLIGVILVLNAGKTLWSGEPLTTIHLVGIPLAVVNILAILGPDGARRSVGVMWLATATLGILALVLGAGLEIKWLVDLATPCLFGGLMMGWLFFMPDTKS